MITNYKSKEERDAVLATKGRMATSHQVAQVTSAIGTLTTAVGDLVNRVEAITPIVVNNVLALIIVDSETGLPVDEATVAVKYSATQTVEIETGDDGVAVFRGVPNGERAITINASDYTEKTTAIVMDKADTAEVIAIVGDDG